MSPPRPKPATIDEYIAAFDPAVRAVLEQVRRAVREAAPEAREAISYGIPALKGNGTLVYFAAFKKHIGFFPPIKGNARLTKAAARYAGEKGNLRFPLAEPMPLKLIQELTKLRVKQDAAQAVTRRRTRGAESKPSRARR